MRFVTGVFIVGCCTLASGACTDRQEEGAKRDEAAAAAKPSRSVPRFPDGFAITRTVPVDSAGLGAFSDRLGGEVVSVVNYFLASGDTSAQVNIITGSSETETARIFETLSRNPGMRKRLALKSRRVVEFVGMTPALMHEFRVAMDLLDRKPRRYRVEARLGLVDQGNGGDTTELLNLLLKPRPEDAAWTGALERLKKKIRFGRTLRLRRDPTPAGAPSYRLRPEPVSVAKDGLSWVYAFDQVDLVHGIPTVALEAEVATAGFTDKEADSPDRATLTAATPIWPTKNPKITTLAARLCQDQKSDEEKLRSIHGWVVDHIRYGGRRGSRDGTLVVLERKLGQCWDMADVLVTLARAAGLPARQVAGWVEGLSGHIWAEVYLEGRGWVSVDPTVPWLGVGGEYVPLMVTEDGEMPVLHARIPVLERLE